MAPSSGSGSLPERRCSASCHDGQKGRNGDGAPARVREREKGGGGGGREKEKAPNTAECVRDGIQNTNCALPIGSFQVIGGQCSSLLHCTALPSFKAICLPRHPLPQSITARDSRMVPHCDPMECSATQRQCVTRMPVGHSAVLLCTAAQPRT